MKSHLHDNKPRTICDLEKNIKRTISSLSRDLREIIATNWDSNIRSNKKKQREAFENVIKKYWLLHFIFIVLCFKIQTPLYIGISNYNSSA